VTEEDLHRQRVDRGGIHCVRANASQNLLACSGGRREDHKVYVLNLKSQKWATVRRGAGHTDWVFTLNWISDSTFVTGSRDASVMVWQPGATDGYDMTALARYTEHEAKVRYVSGLMPPPPFPPPLLSLHIAAAMLRCPCICCL
jgi:WD40 repeat protein